MSKDSRDANTEAVNGPKLAAEILKRLPKKDQERIATAIFREEPELYAKVHTHLTAKEPLREQKAPTPAPMQLPQRPSVPKAAPLPLVAAQPLAPDRENAIQDEEAQRRAVDELLNSAPRPPRKNGRYA